MLHHELVVATEATDPTTPSPEGAETIVFLHGILGSSPNLRTLARKVIEGTTRRALLLDLPAHGRSPDPPLSAASLAGCEAALTETLAALSITPRAIVGHSFGGKVAMEYVARHGGPRDAFFLDSAPGERVDRRGSEETVDVLRILRALPRSFATKPELVAALSGHGLSHPVAQWLAMSSVPVDGGVALRFDLAVIDSLLDSYFSTSFWPMFESPPASTRLHVVIGARSTVYLPADRERLSELASPSLTVDLVDAGHWVHVDALAPLTRILRARLET